MSTRILARLIFSSSKYCRHRKCYSFKNCVALLPWFRDCHFDGSASSNVRYVACSHETDCHAESPAGRVQCFKMAKIDPVSPFTHSLIDKSNFAKRKSTRSSKNEHLGCKCLLLCFSKLEVFTQLPPAYHENSWSSMVSYKDSFNNLLIRSWYCRRKWVTNLSFC